MHSVHFINTFLQLHNCRMQFRPTQRLLPIVDYVEFLVDKFLLSLRFDGPNSSEREFFSLFQCHVCHRPCNVCRYIAPIIEHFSLLFRRLDTSSVRAFFDAKCANLPKRVKHIAHPNQGLLMSRRKYGPCPCCLRDDDPGEWNFICRCTTCSYNLHPKCALYPSTVRHRYDKHPLKLTVKPIDNRLQMTDFLKFVSWN